MEGRRGDLELLKGAVGQVRRVGQKEDVPVETGSRHVGQQVERDVLAAAVLIASEMQG